VTRSEPAGRICRTFEKLSSQTWLDLRDAEQMGHELGEESITDFLILALKRLHRYEMWINKFNKAQEGRTTGADWEWWFGANSRWFGMRVQAKKIDTGTLKYTGLYHTVRKGRRKQINLLLRDARRRRLYPLYCFYSYWDTRKVDLPWSCCSFPPQEELCGCTIADAYAVRQKMRMRAITVKDLSSIWLPWVCLVCCNGYGLTEGASLPERARNLVQQISDSPYVVPEIGSAPHYVLRLQEQRPESYHSFRPEQLDFLGDVDGILVVKERGGDQKG